ARAELPLPRDLPGPRAHRRAVRRHGAAAVPTGRDPAVTFAGLTLAQLWPLFAAGAGAITVLYLLRMRRRQVVVPFAALWERVTRESESRRLWRRLRRLLSWLLQLVVLALVCLALGDPRPEVWLRDPVSVAIVVDTSASMAG